MEIGKVKRIIKVEPEPFPLGHPENDPEESSPLPLKVPSPDRERELEPAWKP